MGQCSAEKVGDLSRRCNCGLQLCSRWAQKETDCGQRLAGRLCRAPDCSRGRTSGHSLTSSIETLRS